MAGRRSPVTEIREILRRLQLGERARRIARDLEVSRNTVAHYRRWAATHGLLTGPLPEPAALAALLAAPPGTRPALEQSLVEPFGEQVLAWHAKGVEGQAIWQLLVEQHGFAGSYSSVKRFLRRVAPPTTRATMRIEVDPGEETRLGPKAKITELKKHGVIAQVGDQKHLIFYDEIKGHIPKVKER